MNAIDIERCAERLAGARLDSRRELLDAQLRPANVLDAYSIQDRITARLAASIAGWKVGAPNPATEPTAAPIYQVLASGAGMPAHRFHMIGVEAEIAFVLGDSLRPRDTAYSITEALDAVAEIRIAIEVCDSRLSDWQSASDLTKLADHQLNVALVLGDAVKSWRRIDFRDLEVRTLVDGNVLKEGRGCHALGDPTPLLGWLANHAATRGGLAAGMAITTGSWLGMHFVNAGARVRVEFPALGSAEIEFPR